MHIQPPRRAAWSTAWRHQADASSTPQPSTTVFYRILLLSTKAENVKYIHGNSINTVNTTPLPISIWGIDRDQLPIFIQTVERVQLPTVI